jgi:hypothetical protein
MMSKSFSRLRAASAILLPGGVALAIVVRTLAVYWGRDWLAAAVVSAIAGALVIGLWELLVRQRRLAQLDRELRALPRTPDASTLELAGPQVSALLRARLEQQPMPLVNDGLAPFLTGLLVMLGLLGTLLGLFQTLQGAGHALTRSADLDALRLGLSAPIAGLTRSFGCAAAGISASAMLGLASALLRRRETLGLRAVYAYALGPLREQSQSARQLRAIELLARQGGGLPSAADAIERVGEKLGAMSEKLIALQQSALEAQHKGLRELSTDVRRELSKAAGETGTTLQARVAPLLEQLAARSGEAIAQQSGAFAEVAKNLGRELEQDAARRRDEAAEALQAMRVRLDQAEAARADAHAKELATLTSLHARTVGDAERREQALGERWQDLVGRLDQQLEAARSSELERLGSLDAQVATARDRETEHASRLASSSARVHAELERLSSALSRELEQRRTLESEQAERAERATQQLSAAGGAIEGLVERMNALLPELAGAAQAGAVNTLERLQAIAEAQAERSSQLEATLAEERHDHARGLAEQLERHSDGIEQRLTRTTDAVEDAAAIWRASTAEMQAVAQMFATSVERQREAAEAWLESLGAIESAVEQAGRGAASDALTDQLASTQELFARQLQFQRELLTQLRTLRGGPGKIRSATGGQDVPAGE